MIKIKTSKTFSYYFALIESLKYQAIKTKDKNAGTNSHTSESKIKLMCFPSE